MAWLSGWAAQRIACVIDSSKIGADLTDFPVKLRISESSGITAEDLSAFFTAMTPEDAADFASDTGGGFTGTDGDQPDTKWWIDNTIPGESGGIANIYNNTLRVNPSSGTTNFYRRSAFMLRGDFDIQIDFEVVTGPATNAWFLNFGLRDWRSSYNLTELWYEYNTAYRWNARHRKANAAVAMFGTPEVETVSTSKMRAVRTGTSVELFRWNGTGWTSYATCADAGISDDDTQIFLQAMVNTGNPTIDCRFDNLVINSGTLIWPHQNHNPKRKKIAVTTDDGETQCYVEIQSWNHADKDIVLWVKAPSVLAASDTTLYLYYDPTHADNTDYVGDTQDTPAKLVWDSNFKLVMHMEQEPSLSSNLDSSQQAKIMTSASLHTGLIVDDGLGDHGVNFDGSADGMRLSSGYDTSGEAALTMEAFAKKDTKGNFDTMLHNCTSLLGCYIYTHGSSPARASMSVNCTNGQNVATNLTTINTGTIYYFAGGWTAGGYPSCVVNTSVNLAGGVGTGVFVRAGAKYEIASQDSISRNGYEWDGAIYEIRYSNIERALEWMQATNYTLRDALVTFAFEEGETDTCEVVAGTPAGIGWSINSIAQIDVAALVTTPGIVWSPNSIAQIHVATLAGSPQIVYEIPAYLVAIDYFVAAGAPAGIAWAVPAHFTSDGFDVGCPGITWQANSPGLIHVATLAGSPQITWEALQALASIGLLASAPTQILWEVLETLIVQNKYAIGIMSKPTVSAGKPSATATTTQPSITAAGAGPSITATTKQPADTATGAGPSVTATAKGE